MKPGRPVTAWRHLGLPVPFARPAGSPTEVPPAQQEKE